MYNLRLYELILEESPIWNKWRMHNPNEEVDLPNADLTNANLAEKNLSNVKLSYAKLFGAKLTRANLEGAQLDPTDLTCADLSEANLKNAWIGWADLTEANLSNTNLSSAKFTRAILKKAKLSKANLFDTKLWGADFANADLRKAQCISADFSGADLSYADLSGALLTNANLSGADLTSADLTEATLENAILVETNIEQTILKNCSIYGLSAWALKGKPKDQSNLLITKLFEAKITVDDLQVAQFIYLLLNRENLRNVLETITSKAVLILGRFTPERKIILDSIAEELRSYNLLPIIFDFERATSRDFTETIKILSGMSLFVVADISNPKSAPLELQAIIPDYQIPFVSIIQTGEKRFSMFDDLIGKYDWVLPPIVYSSVEALRQVFKDLILERAIEKHKELQAKKAKEIQILSADEYLKKKSEIDRPRY